MCKDKNEKLSSFANLFSDYKDDYHPELVDWGTDVGAEALSPYDEEGRKRFYTAIFKKEEAGYSVFFPAVDKCFAIGDTKEVAYKNALMALSAIITTSIETNANYTFPIDTTECNYEMQDGDFIKLVEYIPVSE